MKLSSILLCALPTLIHATAPSVADLITAILPHCPRLQGSSVEQLVNRVLNCSSRLYNTQRAQVYPLLHQLIRLHYPILYSSPTDFPQHLLSLFQRLEQVCPPGSLSHQLLSFAEGVEPVNMNLFPILHSIGCHLDSILALAHEAENSFGNVFPEVVPFLGHNEEKTNYIFRVMFDIPHYKDFSCTALSQPYASYSPLQFYVSIFSAFPDNATAREMLKNLVMTKAGADAEACLARLALAAGWTPSRKNARDDEEEESGATGERKAPRKFVTVRGKHPN